jgi:hypothetical protein
MEGAGIAWFIRCLLETVVMTLLANRYAPGSGPVIGKSAVMVLLALLLMAGVALVPSFLFRLVLVALELVLFLALGWRWLLGPDEQKAILAVVGKIRKSKGRSQKEE